MAWLAVDKDGKEFIYSTKPLRYNDILNGGTWVTSICPSELAVQSNCIKLPTGCIKQLLGRELTWEDEPVELN